MCPQVLDTPFQIFLSGVTFLSGVATLLFTLIPSATTPSVSLTNGTAYANESISGNITSTNSILHITAAHQDNDNYATTFWTYLCARGFFV